MDRDIGRRIEALAAGRRRRTRPEREHSPWNERAQGWWSAPGACLVCSRPGRGCRPMRGGRRIRTAPPGPGGWRPPRCGGKARAVRGRWWTGEGMTRATTPRRSRACASTAPGPLRPHRRFHTPRCRWGGPGARILPRGAAAAETNAGASRPPRPRSGPRRLPPGPTASSRGMPANLPRRSPPAPVPPRGPHEPHELFDDEEERSGRGGRTRRHAHPSATDHKKRNHPARTSRRAGQPPAAPPPASRRPRPPPRIPQRSLGPRPRRSQTPARPPPPMSRPPPPIRPRRTCRRAGAAWTPSRGA